MALQKIKQSRKSGELLVQTLEAKYKEMRCGSRLLHSALTNSHLNDNDYPPIETAPQVVCANSNPLKHFVDSDL